MAERVICEKCGAEMIPASSNKSIGMECPACGHGWTTTQIDPIYEDDTVYKVILDEGNATEKEKLKAVTQIKDCNFIKAKEIICGPRQQLIAGKAYEIVDCIKILKEAGLMFHTEPEYPY